MTKPYTSMPVDQYRIRPGSSSDPSELDPNETGTLASRTEGRRELKRTVAELDRLQRLLWAGGRHRLLIVLQAMDTGGKDGTIRKVFGRINPQGVTVTGFKVPTAQELAHDYLWRVHRHAPASGEIAVFNRSHYEDVLVVRVLGLVPPERWSRRYAHIRDFERRLVDEGTTVVKFFLNISKDEQRRRLQARLDNPEKRWKFNASDLDHRKLWSNYMEAYAAALGDTSTEEAPWYVVPANKKWYRDVVVASTVVRALQALDLKYPTLELDVEGIEVV